MAERLVLFAVARLRGESLRYAERLRTEQAGVAPGVLAQRVQTQAALISRVDGAVAGTPFLLALVPAYVAVLWEQARMVLRIAALMGRDLEDPRLPAQVLFLRGVYATSAEAEAALLALPSGPHRGLAGGVRNVIAVGRRVGILAGFLSPVDDSSRSRLRRALAFVGGAALWVFTWIFPTAFMVAMSYSCETSTRALGARAREHYGGDSAKQAESRVERSSGRHRRQVATLLLGLSLLLPIAVVVLGVSARVPEFTWQRTVVGTTGLAVVLALFAASTRRRLR